jgi:hypothetical protein
MPKVYVCPFCGIEKLSKNQMDFHVKYNHSTLQHLIHEDVEIHGIEEKLDRLSMQKRVLEKEIKVLKKIIEIKNDKLIVFVHAT